MEIMTGIPFYDSNRPGEIISPLLINAYSAMTVPAYWRAVNFLADNLSSFPRCVRLAGAESVHPLNKIIKRRPNAYQNSTQLWRTFFGHAANYGNGYIQILRNTITGDPVSLHNRLPENVWPFRFLHDGDVEPTQYYFIPSRKEIIFGEDMLHISALSYDGMSGHNVVWMHRESLQRALTLDMFMTRFLQKGTVVRGAIQVPGSATPEQVDTLINLIRTQFRGMEAERDVLVLTDGATLNNTTLSPEQSKLIEMGAYSVKQIAQVTGVPPQFLYEFSEQKYNGASVEAMGQDVVRFTFRPWIEQTEDELTLKLLSESEQDQGYDVHIDPNALIRGDTATTVTTVVGKVSAGLETRNEGRKELGLPPSADPEADKLKTLGDTTPQANRPAPPVVTPPAAGKDGDFAKQHLKLSHFSELLADAADRVHKKTSNAIDNAKKKFEKNAAGWTPWANVFATEQTHYAAAAIAPVFKTYTNLSGKPTDGMADKAGGRYGRELGQHLMAVQGGRESTPPDLAAIALLLGAEDANAPYPESVA